MKGSKIESIDIEIPEGCTASMEEPEFYCSMCGRKIVTPDRILQLITVQENGKRYTGVICEHCTEKPPCQMGERVIAMQMVIVDSGFCLRVHDH